MRRYITIEDVKNKLRVTFKPSEDAFLLHDLISGEYSVTDLVCGESQKIMIDEEDYCTLLGMLRNER